MFDLTRFELKKIWAKKIVLAGFALLLIFNDLLYKSSSHIIVWPNQNSDYLRGLEAIEFDKKITQKYEGLLTNEKVQEMLKDFMPSESFLQQIGGMNIAAIVMNSTQTAVQSRFANPDGTWNGMTVKDIYGNNEIQVGYNTGWLNTCFYMIKLIMALGIFMILVISPVFSGEYSGMDAIILTSKYGKTKCVSAKLIAAFVSAFFITTVFVILNLVAAYVTYGAEGLNASISFSSLNYFETLPCGMVTTDLLTYKIILAFTSVIGIAALTLIISSVYKNTFATLAVAAAIHVIPIMLPISEHHPLFKYLSLFPIYQGQTILILSLDKISWLGSKIPYAIIAIPVVLTLCAIGCIVSKRAFSEHQVA